MPRRPCFLAALALPVSRLCPPRWCGRALKNPEALRTTPDCSWRARENAQPVLRIVLPGQSESNRAIEVIFPEHVTARRRGSIDAVQLYMFRREPRGERPTWRRIGSSLEYERELPGAVHMLARATLEDDGVRFLYQFSNRSDVVFDMIYAVTDPRLTSVFHDVRLERTYVHHTEGFDLLASETPDRLTIPHSGCHLGTWLRSLGPCQQSESSVAETVSAITTSRERSIYP